MAESTLKLGTGEAIKENRLGLKPADYQGGKSTLCAACGHDAVSNQIVRAFFEMSVKAEQVAKFSGIGCSSKTPAYFLQRSHGFNSVHGRMPAVATGAMLANHTLKAIGVSERHYDQSALAASFRHTLPHRNVSIELHREHGSVTTVPLPDPHASSLIWVGRQDEIARFAQANDADFIAALGERLGDLLGAVSDPGAKAAFSVAGLTAHRLAARRTALLGEAAHILPPIGAQGLNLGFRDAGALADCVADALAQKQDPGGAETLTAYAEARRLDVMTRTLGVDLLSRSLLTSLPPVQAARGIVLHGLNVLGPLKRAVMRIGLTPPTALPRLMRPRAG